MSKGIHIFSVPLFGVILPYIGKRPIPLNRDLTVVNTGQFDILDEQGFYFTEPWVFEWLGLGFALSRGIVRRSDTGKPLLDDGEAT